MLLTYLYGIVSYMSIFKAGHSFLSKAIAMVWVCLFSINGLSWANPDALSPIIGNPDTYTGLKQEMRRRYDLHNDVSIDPFIKSHLGSIYPLTGRIDPNHDFAAERRAIRNTLEEALTNSGAGGLLYRLENETETLNKATDKIEKGVQIQLLILKDDEKFPVFEREEVGGHASNKYLTIFVREKELPDIRSIAGKIFYEIRARSHRPDQELKEFEKNNRKIEQEVSRCGQISDPALREEFARLEFPADLDIMHRDYAMIKTLEKIPSTKRETAWQENLSNYLAALSNRRSNVQKAIRLISSGRPVLLEFGCGNAELARAIAEKHPEIAVIATDIYDSSDTNKTIYRHTALYWEQQALPAQESELSNLVILRSTDEALNILPSKCLKYVMIIHPDPLCLKSLLQSIHDNNRVLTDDSHIYIKPFYEDRLGEFLEEYKDCDIKFNAISLFFALDVDVTFYSTWLMGTPIYDRDTEDMKAPLYGESAEDRGVLQIAAKNVSRSTNAGRPPTEPAPAAQPAARNSSPSTAVMQAGSEPVQAAHNIIKEAGRIHAENLKYAPAAPDNTILCHIIADSILPVQQRNMLKTLEQRMRSEKYGEKVVSLSVKDPNSPEEFMKELEIIRAREEARYQGYKVQFDVACHNIGLVGKIQAKGMQALAFSKKGEGDIIHVEGIILALRALQTGSINNLLNVYEILTGMGLAVGINDIDELARMILFILPARKLDVNAIGTLNGIIEDNIRTAA